MSIVLSGSAVTPAMIHSGVALYSTATGVIEDNYAEILIGLHRINPQTVWCIETNHVITGMLVILPIDKSAIQSWIAGEMDEIFDRLSIDHTLLRSYIDEGLYSLVIELITIHPDYPKAENVSLLMGAFSQSVLSWARQGMFIADISTEVYNKEGERMANFFGMRAVRDTLHGKILLIDQTPETFIHFAPHELEEYNSLYKAYFGKYRF